MKLTNFFLTKKLSALAIIIGLLVLGLYGFSYLPVDFLPNITYPMIKIHIWWRGATPDEIDKSIADPIERQVSTVDDLDYIESSSIEGMYTLLVNFKYGTDVNVGYQDVLAAMARVARELPKDIDPPVVIKADPSQLPVVQLTISSDLWSLTKIRTWVDEWLQKQMISVPGVAGTEIVGGLKREIRIHIDPSSLEKYNLTVAQVAKTVEEDNVELFAGRVTVGKKEIIARTTGEFKSLEQIKNVIIQKQGINKVYLKDIAEIVNSHEEARIITRLNQKACVKLSVLKQSSANTVKVSNAVLEKIKGIHNVVPQGLKLGIVENQAEYIEDALDGVKNNAFQAAILVVLIVWLFLGSIRQVLVIVCALPLTLIFNFALMKLMGFSLNIFSLGGLVIAIGILVDNSIIVIETVSHRKKENPDKSIIEVASNASKEIGPALIAGTLSFMALFVPFLLVPGLLSLLFTELILVIAGIVVTSLFMAVTVTPMLTSVFMRDEANTKNKGMFAALFTRITTYYGLLVQALCKIPKTVLLIFVIIASLSFTLLPYLGSEFLPRLDDGRVMIKVKLPTGTSVDQTNKLLSKIEENLQDFSEISTVFTLAGGKVWGLYTFEIANEGELDIQLVPLENRKITTKQFIKKLRPIIAKIPVPGGKAMVMQMKVKGIKKIGNSDIELKIRGDNITKLYEIAGKAKNIMNGIPELTNVNISMDMTKPEYQIVVDRVKASEIGVSVSDVSKAVRSLVNGTIASRYRDGDEYYNIRLLIPETKIVGTADIEDIPIISSAGKVIRIIDVAEVVQTVGPVEIVRESQTKQIIVSSDANGKSIGQALNALKNKIAKLNIPEGIQLNYGGQAEMMADMKNSVIRIMVLAFFLSFIVLMFQFNQLSIPALVIICIPFCISGIIFAMALSEFPLGATVLIGLIVVFAATVNDGVLLYTYADELKSKESLNAAQAVVKAATIRLRPRVMTTMSTLMGFIPLAIGLEAGAGMLQPMAIAAIGGLTMEIFVALLLMPCLYILVWQGKRTTSDDEK